MRASTRIEAAARMPPKEALELIAKVARALGYAHQRAIVHRDIKPANIYACRLGTSVDFVKVLDFGLVKQDIGIDRPLFDEFLNQLV